MKMVPKIGGGPRCSVFLCVRDAHTRQLPSLAIVHVSHVGEEVEEAVAAGPPEELKVLYLYPQVYILP